jgi:hypothetical protein
MEIPVRMHQTRTATETGESQSGLFCQAKTTRLIGLEPVSSWTLESRRETEFSDQRQSGATGVSPSRTGPGTLGLGGGPGKIRTSNQTVMSTPPLAHPTSASTSIGFAALMTHGSVRRPHRRARDPARYALADYPGASGKASPERYPGVLPDDHRGGEITGGAEINAGIDADADGNIWLIRASASCGLIYEVGFGGYRLRHGARLTQASAGDAVRLADLGRG